MTLIAGSGSVPLTRRAGGPDLARGLALLGIGLANTIGWLHGSQWTVLLKQVDATVIDRIADVLIGLLADNRGFPLFAMLFGYGIGVLYRRSREHGEPSRRFLMRMLRRHVVLLAIGMAHALLLFSGDILVAYAMVGMFCVLLVTRHRIALPIAAVLALPALGVWGWTDGTIGLSSADGYAAASAPDYLTGLRLRADAAVYDMITAVLSDIGLLSPMAIGAIAARIRLLELVTPNRDLLVPIARWGLGIGLIGAVPLVTVLVVDPAHRLLEAELPLGILGVLHQCTGVVGAAGAAAAAALVADRVTRSEGIGMGQARQLGHLAVRGIEALGAVSLSAYVAQSVVFIALFPPYTLDLGARLGTAGAAVIVVAGWLGMIVLAVALRRRGRRGPLEWVLRRLAGSTTHQGARA
ncbi:DUF418 domain-containing protein [Brachybacterium sp. GCM10030267]|uniref:DUF418 domain-containing protein n=1 Tax=Brachybacterium sp. GCM10030267 TaxID=3273381 RepID=UPI003614D7FB